MNDSAKTKYSNVVNGTMTILWNENIQKELIYHTGMKALFDKNHEPRRWGIISGNGRALMHAQKWFYNSDDENDAKERVLETAQASVSKLDSDDAIIEAENDDIEEGLSIGYAQGMLRAAKICDPSLDIDIVIAHEQSQDLSE